MTEKDSSSSTNALPSTTKLDGVILILTFLIKVGKYLPWIVLAFALVNVALAAFYFIWRDNLAGGLVNLIFATAGFVFFAQLVKRRSIHRNSYRYAGKEPSSGEKNVSDEKEAKPSSAPEVRKI
ncbi:MAG: hypothetical protein M3298_06265 [Thermoproteota archaeon]|nr:hypothetical protein [Thermoproteota archaeon]MDQ3807757.1 hypothetical protein [Thermoproteota archaeon]